MTATMPSRWRKGILTATLVAALAIGTVVAPSAASAATTQCGPGVCTVYLNKAETGALAAGRVPNLNLGAFTVPYKIAAYGHVAIAKLWVQRGNCVGFTLNIRPWATQGMFGWRC